MVKCLPGSVKTLGNIHWGTTEKVLGCHDLFQCFKRIMTLPCQTNCGSSLTFPCQNSGLVLYLIL